MYEILAHKRDGAELSRAEIDRVIEGATTGTIPDYQLAALLMAIFCRGLSPRETADLTLAMVASGAEVDLSSLPGPTVDKHSTGGVGDKTTLVLGPLLAAAGLTVAKMSGRGLGHTGGTLDKLESIPGMRTDLGPVRMIEQARAIGLAVVAQSSELAPADGVLYALRDVTATVESIPLIASSIMSKKLAAGAQSIVLDVKTGAGAFMRAPDDAFALAHAMVEIGSRAGRRMVAVITGMEQPLGLAVGNALEVAEALETLRGGGPDDLRRLCLILGGELLVLAGQDSDPDAGAARLAALLDDGSALERFRRFVAAQGGDPRVADAPDELLPRAPLSLDLPSPSAGYVAAIDALAIGEAARQLGAGRQRKGDPIDPAAGLILRAKVGDYLAAGAAWATLFASDPARLAAGAARLDVALRLGVSIPALPRSIYGTVREGGREERLEG